MPGNLDQDFTTFTEVDPETKITKTATTITIADIAGTDESWVYKDYGAGFFKNGFEHYFDMQWDTSDGPCNNICWGLDNTAGGSYDDWAARDTGVAYYYNLSNSGTAYPGLINFVNGDSGHDSNSGAAGEQQWFSVNFQGSVVTMERYNDAERTSLQRSIDCAVASDSTYQYLEQFGTEGSDTNVHAGSISNLSFRPDPPGGVSGFMQLGTILSEQWRRPNIWVTDNFDMGGSHAGSSYPSSPGVNQIAYVIAQPSKKFGMLSRIKFRINSGGNVIGLVYDQNRNLLGQTGEVAASSGINTFSLQSDINVTSDNLYYIGIFNESAGSYCMYSADDRVGNNGGRYIINSGLSYPTIPDPLPEPNTSSITISAKTTGEYYY